MSMIRKFILGCALSIAALSPVAEASAMPMAVPGIAVDKSTDVTDVRMVCDYSGCYRDWRPRHHRPRYYRDRYYRDDYRPAYRPRRGSHVEWCLNRYRSYNPRNNLYLAYEGVYRECRSPWG